MVQSIILQKKRLQRMQQMGDAIDIPVLFEFSLQKLQGKENLSFGPVSILHD